jgi:hypothetical protein
MSSTPTLVDVEVMEPARHRGSAPLRRTGARVIVAWLASLSIHLSILVVMFAVVFPYAPGDHAPVPPDVRTRVVGSIDAPTPDRVDAALPTSDVSMLQPTRPHLAPEMVESPAELMAPEKPELSIIGIGAGGGDYAGLGLTLGRGGGPEFFGLGSAARGARRIVYVVDRSGSMLDSFPLVQAELRRSVSALRRSQQFHVMFYNTGPPLENPPKRLVPAIEAYKEEFFTFLESVGPSGGTDPAPSLERALELEPDLIYFLSDGDRFNPRLLNQLDAWNRERRVQIFTIAYIDQSGRDILELIAREHGGEFKFVSEYDLP